MNNTYFDDLAKDDHFIFAHDLMCEGHWVEATTVHKKIDHSTFCRITNYKGKESRDVYLSCSITDKRPVIKLLRTEA